MSDHEAALFRELVDAYRAQRIVQSESFATIQDFYRWHSRIGEAHDRVVDAVHAIKRYACHDPCPPSET